MAKVDTSYVVDSQKIVKMYVAASNASGAYQNKCNSEGDIDVLKVDGF